MDEQQFQRLKQENLRLRVTVNQLEDELKILSSFRGSLMNLITKLILKLDYFDVIKSHKPQLKEMFHYLKNCLVTPKPLFSKPNLFVLDSSPNLSDIVNSYEVDVLMCLQLTFGHASILSAKNFIDNIVDIRNILCIFLSSDYFHIIDLLLKMKKELTLVECSEYKGITSKLIPYVFALEFDHWLAKEKYGDLNDYDAIFIPDYSPKHYISLLSGRVSSNTKIFVLPHLS